MNSQKDLRNYEVDVVLSQLHISLCGCSLSCTQWRYDEEGLIDWVREMIIAYLYYSDPNLMYFYDQI